MHFSWLKGWNSIKKTGSLLSGCRGIEKASDPNQLSLHASGLAVNKRTKIEMTSLERGTTKLYNDTRTFWVHRKMAAVAAVIRRKTWKIGHKLKAVYNHEQSVVSILPLSSSRPSPRAEKLYQSKTVLAFFQPYIKQYLPPATSPIS